MSIHEVLYDAEDKIIRTTCLDPRIRLANNKLVEVLVEEDGSPVDLDFGKLPELVEETILSTNPGEVFPFKRRIVTALTPDSISETSHIFGYDVSSGQRVEDKFTKVQAYPDRVYIGKQINAANIRVGRVGWVWTETGKQVDVYVAPQKQTGLFSRIKEFIKR